MELDNYYTIDLSQFRYNLVFFFPRFIFIAFSSVFPQFFFSLHLFIANQYILCRLTGVCMHECWSNIGYRPMDVRSYVLVRSFVHLFVYLALRVRKSIWVVWWLGWKVLARHLRNMVLYRVSWCRGEKKKLNKHRNEREKV